MIERCKIVAKAYLDLDPEPLIEALADDCIYESQKVIEPIVGKAKIEDFMRAKFQTISNSGAFVEASVRRVVSGPVIGAYGQPCVVLKQGDTGAVVLLTLSDTNQIARIDLCIVPTPADTELIG
jgi:hypothetical protein